MLYYAVIEVVLNHLAEETYTSVSDQLEMSQISNEKLQADSLDTLGSGRCQDYAKCDYF